MGFISIFHHHVVVNMFFFQPPKAKQIGPFFRKVDGMVEFLITNLLQGQGRSLRYLYDRISRVKIHINEPRKIPWLVGLSRGLYYPVI